MYDEDINIWYVFNCVNPLTPMSDQDRISPYNINKKWWGPIKVSIRGLTVDPIPNSQEKTS